MPSEEEMISNLTTKAIFLVIGAAILTAVQISPGQEEHRSTVRSEMLVSTAWLQNHLNDRDLIVLQVGPDRARFDSGHIPGSRFLRLDDLVEQHADSLNELPSADDLRETFEALGIGARSRVVLVDDLGGMLAARAYFTLDYLGHGDKAVLLSGGLTVWIAESRSLSKEQPTITRAQFVPHIHREILISTAQMRELSAAVSEGSQDYALLDARPIAEHTGMVNSESVSQAGHIAGSRSLYWKRLIGPEGNPQLLPAHDLLRQFRIAGAWPGKLVITYCRTGMQSSFTYFVAKYLGYRVAMYDGSVYEWVRTSGNRLVRSPPPNSAVTAHQ